MYMEHIVHYVCVCRYSASVELFQSAGEEVCLSEATKQRKMCIAHAFRSVHSPLSCVWCERVCMVV